MSCPLPAISFWEKLRKKRKHKKRCTKVIILEFVGRKVNLRTALGSRVWKWEQHGLSVRPTPSCNETHEEKIYTWASLRVAGSRIGLGAASEGPLLLLGLLAVHAGGADRRRVEHARGGHVY